MGSPFGEYARKGQTPVESHQCRNVPVIGAQPVLPAEGLHWLSEILFDRQRQRVCARLGESVEIKSSILRIGEKVLGVVLSPSYEILDHAGPLTHHALPCFVKPWVRRFIHDP